MATEFSIDDAFALEGEEVGQDKEREPGDGASLSFGPLSFSKPQGLPSAGVVSSDHSSLKYQNLENEEVLSSSRNSSFNNFFKISDPSTLSYCSSQWSFSTISSVTQLSAHCCSWTSHPLVKKNRRVVLASFLLFITGLALIFTGVVIQLNSQAGKMGGRGMTVIGVTAVPSPLDFVPCSQGVSSAIFFVPGFLLFIPGAYHVIYIICAVQGHRGFKFFYLPYFEK